MVTYLAFNVAKTKRNIIALRRARVTVCMGWSECVCVCVLWFREFFHLPPSHFVNDELFAGSFGAVFVCVCVGVLFSTPTTIPFSYSSPYKLIPSCTKHLKHSPDWIEKPVPGCSVYTSHIQIHVCLSVQIIAETLLRWNIFSDRILSHSYFCVYMI